MKNLNGKNFGIVFGYSWMRSTIVQLMLLIVSSVPMAVHAQASNGLGNFFNALNKLTENNPSGDQLMFGSKEQLMNMVRAGEFSSPYYVKSINSKFLVSAVVILKNEYGASFNYDQYCQKRAEIDIERVFRLTISSFKSNSKKELDAYVSSMNAADRCNAISEILKFRADFEGAYAEVENRRIDDQRKREAAAAKAEFDVKIAQETAAKIAQRTAAKNAEDALKNQEVAKQQKLLSLQKFFTSKFPGPKALCETDKIHFYEAAAKEILKSSANAATKSEQNRLSDSGNSLASAAPLYARATCLAVFVMTMGFAYKQTFIDESRNQLIDLILSDDLTANGMAIVGQQVSYPHDKWVKTMIDEPALESAKSMPKSMQAWKDPTFTNIFINAGRKKVFEYRDAFIADMGGNFELFGCKKIETSQSFKCSLL